MEAFFLKKFGDSVGAFELRELQLPELQADEIRIRVSHFGLNFADVMARKGLYPDCPPLPAVLGYEILGEVEALGSAVHDFEPGDKVISMTRFGGYASHVHTPVLAATKVPEGIPPGEALALVTQGSTAWYMAEELLRLRKEDRVLVHAAAGGVGSILVQLCKHRGCEVFGTASPYKHDFLRDLGVDHPIDYRKQDYFDAIAEILEKNRLDAIFDPVGGKGFKQGMDLLGPLGSMVCFGASTFTQAKGFFSKIKRFVGFGFYHPMRLMRNSQSLLSANLLRLGDHKPAYLNEILRKVVEAYEAGIIKPHAPFHFPSSSLEEAHAFLESRKSLGKITIDWE